MNSQKLLKLLPGIIVSFLTIVWLYYAEDWNAIGTQLLQVSLWPLIPATILIVAHFWLRALRWKQLLPDSEEDSIPKLFDGIVLSNFASFVLPLRAGEFIRAFFLSRVSNHGFLVSFSSIVAERLFDLLAVLITFSIVIQTQVSLPDWAYHGSNALGFLAVVIVSCIVLGMYCRTFLEDTRDTCLRYFPEGFAKAFADFTNTLLDAVQILKSPKRLFFITLYTILTWLSNYLIFWVLLYSVDVEPGMLLAVTTAVIIALAVAAPSAPGFIGVFEAAGRAGFLALGFPGDVGVTYAILLHIFQYVLFIGYGSYVLISYDLRFEDLLPKKKTAESAPSSN